MKFKKLFLKIIVIVIGIIVFSLSLNLYFYNEEVKYHEEKIGEYLGNMQYIADRVIEIQEYEKSESVCFQLYDIDSDTLLTQNDKYIILLFFDEMQVSRICYKEELHPNVQFGIDGNNAGIVYSNTSTTVCDIRKQYPVYSHLSIYSLGDGWYIFANSMNRYW